MAWTTPTAATTGQVISASFWNTNLTNDLLFLYGDTAWTAPSYTNGWVDFGSGFLTGGFRLVGTRVQLRGLIKSGTMNTAAFALPVGYRPTATVQMATESNSLFGAVKIDSSGVVTPIVGSNADFSLNVPSFDTI